MLKLREAKTDEFDRYFNAIKMDFDPRELLPRQSIRRAIRRGDMEFLLFCDEQSGLPEGYALCFVRNVYGYVLLKYFGIFSWFQGKGHGVEAMRLLHKRYADRQGILAELTAFDDSDDDAYLGKLKRFFRRFGYEEIPVHYAIGGAKAILTAKPIRGTAELKPVAGRILGDFYSRCLRPTEMDKMFRFEA